MTARAGDAPQLDTLIAALKRRRDEWWNKNRTPDNEQERIDYARAAEIHQIVGELAAVAAVPLTPEPERGELERQINNLMMQAHDALVRAEKAEAALRSAAPPSASAPAWQPIESAPKGEWILVIDEAGDHQVAEQTQRGTFRGRVGETIWRPSVWMKLLPVPPPPAQELA